MPYSIRYIVCSRNFFRVLFRLFSAPDPVGAYFYKQRSSLWNGEPAPPPLKMAAHALFLQLAYKFQQAPKSGGIFKVCIMYIHTCLFGARNLRFHI